MTPTRAARPTRATRRPSGIAHPHTAGTEDVDHIAALVHNVRPDWDPLLVRVVLLSHRDQVDASDLAVAALRCAANPDMPSPKFIGWRGPHWDGAATRPVALEPLERCAVCGKTEPRCYSERIGIDDDHAFEPTGRRA